MKNSIKGKKSDEARKIKADQNRRDLILLADKFLDRGVSKDDLVSEVEKQFPLSERIIRDILKAEGKI